MITNLRKQENLLMKRISNHFLRVVQVVGWGWDNKPRLECGLLIIGVVRL